MGLRMKPDVGMSLGTGLRMGPRMRLGMELKIKQGWGCRGADATGGRELEMGLEMGWAMRLRIGLWMGLRMGLRSWLGLRIGLAILSHAKFHSQHHARLHVRPQSQSPFPAPIFTIDSKSIFFCIYVVCTYVIYSGADVFRGVIWPKKLPGAELKSCQNWNYHNDFQGRL